MWIGMEHLPMRGGRLPVLAMHPAFVSVIRVDGTSEDSGRKLSCATLVQSTKNPGSVALSVEPFRPGLPEFDPMRNVT
jgi:hypothetical protein